MRIGLSLATLAGLLIATALIAHHGLTAVADALAAAGWGLILIAILHLVPMVCSTLGWTSVLGGVWRGPWTLFFRARWIREAVDSLLPVAQVGGELIGARMLTFHGAKVPVAGASVVVDLTVEVMTQFLFTVLGVALLLLSGHDDGTVRWVLLGLTIAAPALLGFVMAQRWGLFKLLEQLLERVAEKWPRLSMGDLAGLHDAIQLLYRNPRTLALSSLWHSLSWILGVSEVWLALYLMGHPIGLTEALILESLGQAVRGAAFMVPGALGVQEGGYVLLGAMYGLPPQVGLALSLAKRVREVLLGVPALLAWQFLEGRRLWVARRPENQGCDPR